MTKKQRRKRGAGARERNERPHVYHQVPKNQIFLITYNFHFREAPLPRKTEVEENSNQGMVDRVKMRTGDTGEPLENIDSLITTYFSSYVPV